MARGDPLDRGALRDVRRPTPVPAARRARGASTPPALGGTGQSRGTHNARSADRYDTIGRAYASRRREEPEWARTIGAALAGADRVINVGAGTGNYEPRDTTVLAVEPSTTMLAQRAPGAAPVVQGVAEALPVADASFDVALAILTVHHWVDPVAGLRELERVARRQVVVTWDPAVSATFWLLRDYLPELRALEASLPSLDLVVDVLGDVDVVTLEVPRGCRDGFAGAAWDEPASYLDPVVRAGMSGIQLIDQGVVGRALARLGSDLDDGTWRARNVELASLESLDVGYRLVVTRSRPS